MASLAQMERELIVERTRAGLAAAKQRGRVGGRKRRMTDSKIEAAKKLVWNTSKTDINTNEAIAALKSALYFSIVVTYAQGLAQLHTASKEYNYGLNLETVAKIWRGGCIIRANILEDFRKIIIFGIFFRFVLFLTADA